MWDVKKMGECPGRGAYKQFVGARVQKVKVEQQFMDFKCRGGLRGLILGDNCCALEEAMTCTLRTWFAGTVGTIKILLLFYYRSVQPAVATTIAVSTE